MNILRNLPQLSDFQAEGNLIALGEKQAAFQTADQKSTFLRTLHQAN